MEAWFVVSIILLFLGVALSALWIREKKARIFLQLRAETADRRARDLSERFSAVTDVEEASVRARETLREVEARIDEARNRYTSGLTKLESLDTSVRSLEESLEMIDVSLYRPHFTYADSEGYKRALDAIWERQKAVVKAGRATSCATTWTVGGSAREGERMVKQTEKLILRAFNAECESAVAKVSWNNHEVMKTRITKAFEVLNKHGTVLQVRLTDEYFALRIEELKLVFEAEAKDHQEREERRRQRAEQREEERAQRELARAQAEAEEDETRHEKALAKARAELAAATASEQASMLARIRLLEADLAEAHSRKERAIAQAQLTRVGHVYIISNIGAFGGGVVKVGLTRRLEPEERVKELGDASVPFPFDLHALIYSQDAPALEAKLHERFWERRVNWANDRKEFFRVSLDEVRIALRDLGLEAEVLTLPEAREYRETIAALAGRSVPVQEGQKTSLTARFPRDPFESASRTN